VSISIIVVTYNSAKFIKETLDSIYNQTWSDLELIITDDCSEDRTIDICENWLLENSKRFVNTRLLTVAQNTGASANCNRGLSIAEGEWIKYCSGDDSLLPDCIKDNMDYISLNPEIKALFSYCRMYQENFTEDRFIGLNPGSYPTHIINNKITANEQFKLLLVSNRIPFTPSFFIHSYTRRNFAKIDDRHPLSDDYQLFLSLTRNNIKLHFMDRETMKYRIHNESTSKQLREFIVHPIYFKAEECMKEISYPFLPWDIKFSKIYIWYINHLFKIPVLNRKNRFNSLIYYVLSNLLNPFRYIIYIKSHFCSKYSNNIFYK
jgi:alpha-1,3-rhamnosyltransferase